MKRTIFWGLTIGTLAIVAIVTSSILPAVYADKGGDPNNSGQAEGNALERHNKKVERVDERVLDGNPNNDNGVQQAHDNTHNGKGVEISIG